MDLYSRIKQRREELGMSQDELAAKLGYKDRSTIAKIEAGVNDITQSKIKAFANALNTTTAWLMEWDDSKQAHIEATSRSDFSQIAFYDTFESLCKQKGISPNRACVEMGLSRSIAAKWKNTKTSPSLDVLSKIADYFAVSADSLLSEGKKKFPVAQSSGEYINDTELLEVIKAIEKLPKNRWSEVKGVISHMLYEENVKETSKQTIDHLA